MNLEPIQSVPSDVVNLADHEALARRVLDPNAWAYFSGGAADEHTLHANQQAWRDWRLLPRVLNPLAHSHTRVPLLGRTLAHPVILAPVAYQRMAHPDGELATALGAAALGAGLVVSTQASTLLEHVAQAYRQMAPHTTVPADPTDAATPDTGALWFQLYLQPEREVNRQLLARAEAAGYQAVVLTVDACVLGARDRERRAGFRLPPGIGAVNLPRTNALQPVFTRLEDCLRQAPTWDDVRWLVNATRLPVLLKGVLHPDDARQAQDCGAAGVVVSNHGGRTLDTAWPTALALPAVARAVGPHMAVLVDGGIRRGTDVFKALALGAHAVLIGRPQAMGLAHAGAVGVAHTLRLLVDEFAMAMALCGCATPADIGPDHLAREPASPG